MRAKRECASAVKKICRRVKELWKIVLQNFGECVKLRARFITQTSRPDSRRSIDQALSCVSGLVIGCPFLVKGGNHSTPSPDWLRSKQHASATKGIEAVGRGISPNFFRRTLAWPRRRKLLPSLLRRLPRRRRSNFFSVG